MKLKQVDDMPEFSEFVAVWLYSDGTPNVEHLRRIPGSRVYSNHKGERFFEEEFTVLCNLIAYLVKEE